LDGPRWLTPAPLAEKYYNLSPYIYAANNPINFVVPDGLTHYSLDSLGYISVMYDNGGYIRGEKDKYDRLYSADGNYIQIDNQDLLPVLMNYTSVKEATGWDDETGTIVEDFNMSIYSTANNVNLKWEKWFIF
jgi:hypothetical protein